MNWDDDLHRLADQVEENVRQGCRERGNHSRVWPGVVVDQNRGEASLVDGISGRGARGVSALSKVH